MAILGQVTNGNVLPLVVQQSMTEPSISATAYGVLCGPISSPGEIQAIASVGNAGEVLTSNGAGMLPSFQAAAGGSGQYSFVSAATFATQYASFTGLTADSAYQIVGYNLSTDTGSNYIQFQVSTDNGATWVAANYNYAGMGTYGTAGTEVGFGASGAATIQLVANGGDTNGKVGASSALMIKIDLTTITSLYRMNWRMDYTDTAGARYNVIANASQDATVNAVRIDMGNGTASGNVFLYKLVTA